MLVVEVLASIFYIQNCMKIQNKKLFGKALDYCCFCLYQVNDSFNGLHEVGRKQDFE